MTVPGDGVVVVVVVVVVIVPGFHEIPYVFVSLFLFVVMIQEYYVPTINVHSPLKSVELPWFSTVILHYFVTSQLQLRVNEVSVVVVVDNNVVKVLVDCAVTQK